MRRHTDPPTIIGDAKPIGKSFKDITGQRFGRLTAIRFYGRSNPTGHHFVYFWECRCDCGVTRVIYKGSLLSGASKSCGCAALEILIKRNTTHGLHATREYTSWGNMRSRCTNPRNHKWPIYGGRGIKVCPRWNSFENFFADMGPKPSPKHTIERINNNGNYEPDNCCWATSRQQARNRSDNVHITFQGKTKILSDWAQSVGIDPGVISARLMAGWTTERALTEPPRVCRRKA